MRSKRFPGKVLAKLNKKPVIEYLIELAESLPFPFVVATPDTEDNQPLWDYLALEMVNTFKGHETDLLDRFLKCAIQYKADIIIRLCADTPFITHTDVMLQLGYYEQINRFTYGNGVYIFSIAELKDAYFNAKHSEQREHIIPYMIKCIDWPEDLERWQKLL